MASWRLPVPGILTLSVPVLLFGCIQSGTVLGSSDGGLTDGATHASDGSADGSLATSCSPVGTLSMTPAWVPPTAHQAACTQAQLDSYGACIDSNDSTSSACTPWLGASASSSNAGCYACVKDSMYGASTWGPIVALPSDTGRQINSGGCLALMSGDSSSTSCGASFELLAECGSLACTGPCASATSAALADCVAAADTSICQQYSGAAACVNDAGAALSCFPQGTYGQQFAIVAAPFCLAGDAGP